MMPRAIVARRRGFRSIALRNIRTGGLLGVETKFLDIPITATAIVSNATCASGEIQPTSIVTGCLSAPAQGDGAQNREGKKIVIKSLLLQGTVTLTAQDALATLNTEQFPTIFLAVVQDKQTNGVTVNSEDVFTNISAAAASCVTPFRNMSNTSRFNVLATKTIPARAFFTVASNNASATTISTAAVVVPFKLSSTMRMPVNFAISSTTADVANVIDNSLHLIAFTSSAAMAPVITAGCRIRFVG